MEGREYIRGNRDGLRGRNETYTVCRLRVTADRLTDEIRLGMHRHLVTCSGSCPALGSSYRRHAGSEAGLASWKTARLRRGAREALEIVHPDSGSDASRPTVTICRLGVSRARLVEEVDAKLHRLYRTITIRGKKYVQGVPSVREDNVNHSQPACPLRG